MATLAISVDMMCLYMWMVYLCLVLLRLTGGGPDATADAVPILTTLRHYDAAHSNSTRTRRVGNVDVVDVLRTPDEQQQQQYPHPHTELAYCHLPVLMPLTIVRNNAENTTTTTRTITNAYAPVTDIAAIALAVQHFNAGDGTIVPELEGIDQRCNIRLTYEILDTENSMKKAVNEMIGLVTRQEEQQEQEQQNTTMAKKQQQQPIPCAIVGEYYSSASIPTSMVSGLRDLPQFSPLSTSSALDNKNQYELFGRLIPSDDGTAQALVQFFQFLGTTTNNSGNVDGDDGGGNTIHHFAVLHVDDAYGSAFAFSLQEAAARTASMTITTVSIPIEREKLTPDVIRQRIQLIRETEYRYIVGILFSDQFEPVMEEAYRQGIAGDSLHNWIFTDGLTNDFFLQKRYPQDSPLHLVTSGSGLIGVNPGYAPVYSKFADAIGELDNAEDLEYIASTFPVYNDDAYDNDDDWSFAVTDLKLQDPLNVEAPFLYDTVVALGLAACNAVTANNIEKEKKNEDEDEDDIAYFNGKQHYNQMLQTTFEGASGNIVLNKESGTRESSSAVFTITNIVTAALESDNNTNLTDNVAILSSAVTNVLRDGKWVKVAPYFYNDGTSNMPTSLPIITMVNENHIPLSIRAFCIAMGVLVILFSAGFAVWTHVTRKSSVVQASQPIFLHMICAGTLLMGISIVLLSIDDQVATKQSCTIVCILCPWFFVNGFVIAFTALLVKTRRINKILNQPFRRVKVTIFDVIKIMLLFILSNVLILSLWTGLTEIYWERMVVVTDKLGRTMETSGSCFYDDSLPFIVAIVIVDIGALLFTVYEAYQARNTSTEFAESDYIMKAVVSMLLVCFIGLPVALVAEEHVARLLTFTGIIFVISTSLLGLIFVPKIKFHLERQKNGGSRTSSVIIGQSGRASVTPNRYSVASSSQTPNDRHQTSRIYNDFGLVFTDDSTSVYLKLKQLQIENTKLRNQLNVSNQQSKIKNLQSVDDGIEQKQNLISVGTTQQKVCNIDTRTTLPKMMESSAKEISNHSSSINSNKNENTGKTTIGTDGSSSELEDMENTA